MRLRNGDVWRILNPLVQDLLGGIASARATQQPALALPPAAKTVCDAGEPSASWPPHEGSYTEDGLTFGSAGELARVGLALTAPAVRAFLIGLSKGGEHSRRTVRSIAQMSEALSQVVGRSRYSFDEFVTSWEWLFGRHIREFQFSLSTDGLTVSSIAFYRELQPGVYVADATVTTFDGVAGGSLRISGTASISDKGSITVRSDRTLAQLPSSLVGVDCRFVDIDRALGINVKGLEHKRLKWDVYLSLRLPIKRGEES